MSDPVYLGFLREHYDVAAVEQQLVVVSDNVGTVAETLLMRVDVHRNPPVEPHWYSYDPNSGMFTSVSTVGGAPSLSPSDRPDPDRPGWLRHWVKGHGEFYELYEDVSMWRVEADHVDFRTLDLVVPHLPQLTWSEWERVTT